MGNIHPISLRPKISQWNQLCRTMGQPDFYPFALSRAAVTKLDFVHLVVSEATLQWAKQ
ncbi:MAG TPA: putative zinc-binding metallopeptidase [Bryobacteraceae bacterium]|jgi:hypothetical protein|nr:putative zinc-binding metallopeptidase [Bryobacteraceae bacterium]